MRYVSFFDKRLRAKAKSSPRDNISRYPAGVMFDAAKHGYIDIIDMT